MIKPSPFGQAEVAELKDEFANFVSWNELVEHHGSRMVVDVKPGKSGLRDIEAVDRVPTLDTLSNAWIAYQATEKTDEDLRILTDSAMDVLDVGFLRPYIRDMQLVSQEERSVLDRRVETTLQEPTEGPSMWGKLLATRNTFGF